MSIDKKILENRRRNLQTLINEKFNGNVAKFSRYIDKNPTYIGRCLYEEGKKDKKSIGDEIVLAVIEALNLPPGWLDVENNSIQGEKINEEKPSYIIRTTKHKQEIINKLAELLKKDIDPNDEILIKQVIDNIALKYK